MLITVLPDLDKQTCGNSFLLTNTEKKYFQKTVKFLP